MKHKIFGCKVNKYYTDKWLSSSYLQDKKGIFVASCVVTDKAKRKWIKFVKDNAILLKTWEKVYVSWCWAFEKAKAHSKFFEVYPDLKEYEEYIEVLAEDPPKALDDAKNKLKSITKNLYTKKFVVIQWWCDSFCTFCLTVKKRWSHFSRKKEDILKEINDFEKSGWKEVVLTGVNLCAWWQETTNDFEKPRFSELLRYILDNSKISRLRISSLGPEFIDDKTFEIFKETRIYPHFHFSIQSWSSRVLKSMARHYNADYMRKILEKLRNIKREDDVDISIWADIIVWFPGETQEDFLETYNLVKDFEITKLHAFPFSAHKLWEDVSAWYFDNQIDDKIKKQRLKKLIEMWDHIREDFIKSQKWKTLEVLVESVRDWVFKWWTQNYIETTNDNSKVISGDIKRNNIISWRLS